MYQSSKFPFDLRLISLCWSHHHWALRRNWLFTKIYLMHWNGSMNLAKLPVTMTTGRVFSSFFFRVATVVSACQFYRKSVCRHCLETDSLAFTFLRLFPLFCFLPKLPHTINRTLYSMQWWRSRAVKPPLATGPSEALSQFSLPGSLSLSLSYTDSRSCPNIPCRCSFCFVLLSQQRPAPLRSIPYVFLINFFFLVYPFMLIHYPLILFSD